jgi:flagellar biosynthetic protein FliR
MTIILPELQGAVLIFLLTFARTGAMIMLLPVIGDAGVPPRVRLAFALAVSAALTSATGQYYPSVSPPPMELAALIARRRPRVLVGAMARLIMARRHRRYLIAAQTGLAFAQTFRSRPGHKAPWSRRSSR